MSVNWMPIPGKSRYRSGFDRVHAAILQLVGFELVDKANAAALLRDVQNDARSFGFNASQRQLKLVATIAAQRLQNVAG